MRQSLDRVIVAIANSVGPLPKPRARKLKVFQAQFGFYDTVVAAPSQAAALRAWGTRQDLFASGEARLTTDEAAAKAALEHPETPLRRAVGTNEPFALEPTSLPEIPNEPKRPEPASKAKPPAKAKAPVDRSKLDAAEKALRELDQGRRAEEAAFREQHAALEQREADAQQAYVAARKVATAAVVEARQAFRKAGGSDD